MAINTAALTVSNKVNNMSSASSINNTALSTSLTNKSTNSSTTQTTLEGLKQASSKAKAFITQSSKQVVKEVSFDTDTYNKTEVNKLSKQELSALSQYTGVTINNDDDLEKALGILSTNLKSNMTTKIDLSSGIEYEDIVETGSDSTAQDVKDLLKYTDIDGLEENIAGSYTNKYNVTDINGNPIDGIPSDSNYELTSKIATKAQEMCPDIDLGMFNFGDYLNMFNGLLGLCSSLGLAGLLAALMECRYFDDVSQITGHIDTVANNGDSKTLSTISKVTGTGIVGDDTKKISTLISNLKKDDDITISEVDSIMTDWGVTKSSLSTKNVPGTNLNPISVSKLDSMNTSSNMNRYLLGDDAAQLVDVVKILT